MVYWMHAITMRSYYHMF